MRKGFTLLELIVVIIIVGILAILGFTQYGRTVERSRGSEARSILGDIRKFANAYYMEYGGIGSLTAGYCNVGTANDQIPSACRTSHYFSYGIAVADPTITITATRCTASGKTPNAGTAWTLILTSNLNTGADTWGGTGNY